MPVYLTPYSGYAWVSPFSFSFQTSFISDADSGVRDSDTWVFTLHFNFRHLCIRPGSIVGKSETVPGEN